MRSAGDRFVNGSCVVGYSHRLPAFDARFHHAALIVRRALVATLVAKMNLYPRDAIGKLAQGALDDGTDLAGQCFVTRDVMVCIQFDLQNSICNAFSFCNYLPLTSDIGCRRMPLGKNDKSSLRT
jgi:hypothetical protein